VGRQQIDFAVGEWLDHDPGIEWQITNPHFRISSRFYFL
jgi:hypothetical protein